MFESTFPFVRMKTAAPEIPKFMFIEIQVLGEEANVEEYAHLATLKTKLSPEDYDKVRLALGLRPMAEMEVAARDDTKRKPRACKCADAHAQAIAFRNVDACECSS